MLKSAVAELELPLKVTGVLEEEPAAAFDVVIITSLDSGPTALGVKRAWNENWRPAARVNGKPGRLSLTSAKFAFPEMLKAVTVVATLAVQVIGSASEEPLTDVFAKLIGPSHLSGRLTGDPKA